MSTNSTQLTVDVAIIGAGPAGLTAGYLLTKAGKTVAIIEKDATYVGGISRTVEHEGYRFDIGGHRFFSKSQQVVDMWNEILPDDFIQRPRMSRIYYEGKFYSYPLRAFEALGNLGILRSTVCMASFAWSQLFPIKDIRSFEDWTSNQFGKKLYSIFFKTYTEKVWGMPCNEMSADWAAQRIKGLSLWGAVTDGLKRSLGLNKRPNDGQEVKTLLETFRYPRLGPGMMWDAARDKIVATGKGQVLMGHALDQVAADGEGGWRVSAKGPDGKVVLVCNHELGLEMTGMGPFANNTKLPDDFDAALCFDPGNDRKEPSLGGTSNLVFDPVKGEKTAHFLSLLGTDRNCAGGPMPWGASSPTPACACRSRCSTPWRMPRPAPHRAGTASAVPSRTWH